MRKSNLIKLVNELDIIAAVVIAVISLSLLIYSLVRNLQMYVFASMLLFLSSILYLYIRKHPLAKDLENNYIMVTRNFSYFSNYGLLNILFFIFFFLSLYPMKLSLKFHYRPVTYFILITLAISVLLIKFLNYNYKKDVSLSLLQIILIQFNLIYSQYLIFPSLLGRDPWHHMRYTLEIIELGHLHVYDDYFFNPIYHLGNAIMIFITSLGYRVSNLLFVSISHIMIITIMTFLIGRLIWGERIGLMASLLLSISDQQIDFGTICNIPFSLGIIFLILLAYLLFKEENNNLLLIAILVIVSILTHPLSSAQLFLFISILWFGFFIFKQLFSKYSPNSSVFTSIFTIYAIGMLSWWAYSGTRLNSLILLIKYNFNRSLFFSYHFSYPVEQYLRNIPIFEKLYSRLGFMTMVSISIIGLLLSIQHIYKKPRFIRFSLIIFSFLLLAISGIPFLINASLLQSRWWYLTEIFLVFFVSITVVSLSKSKGIKSLLIIVLLMLTIFMITNEDAAVDSNRLFMKHKGIRQAYTEPELLAAKFVSEYYTFGEYKIITDRDYLMIPITWNLYQNLRLKSGYEGLIGEPLVNLINERYIESLDQYVLKENFNVEGIIIIREEIIHYPFEVGEGVFKINYNPRDILNKAFSCIYNSGQVTGYFR